MNIKRVKLLSNGDKGVKIKYVDSKEQSGKNWDIYCEDEHTFPATTDLRRSFDKLKIHLLKLCRLWDPEQDQYLIRSNWTLIVPESLTPGYKRMQSLLGDLEVVGVTSNLEEFLITGKLKGVDNGNINLVSMNINSETEYQYYDEVIAIIDDLYQHTGSYIHAEIMVEKRKVVNQEAIRNQQVPDSSLTDEQIEAQHAEIMARTGKVIEMKTEENPIDSNMEDLPMDFNDGFDFEEPTGTN